MLDFYPLDDGTFAVGAGKSAYLSAIEIPATYQGKNVTMIVENGFSNNTHLKSIKIPTTVVNVLENAFNDCENLNTIYYGEKVISCYSANGIVVDDVAGLSFGNGAIDGTAFMQLVFEDSHDNDTLVEFNVLNPIPELTKIAVTAKINSVTDVFAYKEMTIGQALDGVDMDFGTYGLFKNVKIELYKNEALYSSAICQNVAVSADHYNFAYMNGTYPVLVASLKMDEITQNGSIPTFVALERNDAYNWDNLPDGVHFMPVFTKDVATRGDFHGRRAEIADYIKDLYEINPDSHFSLYVVDNYIELILEFLVANGIPESNWNAVMLSDGAGTAAILSQTYGTDNPSVKYEAMKNEWIALKKHFYRTGNYEIASSGRYINSAISENYHDYYSVLARYAYVVAKEQSNVEWWVNRLRAGENLVAINTIDSAFCTDIVNSATSFYTNNLLAALTPEQTSEFKALYNFNDQMFAKAVEENKKVMVILGTSWGGEKATFYEQIKLTMNFYGDDYIYYYKGHPGYPTSLYPERQQMIKQLNDEGYTLYEVDNAIAAEVILFFYPDIYSSGWQTSTFDSLESYEKAGILYGVPYANKGSFTYGDMMNVFSTVIAAGTDTYGDISLDANKKYCLLEYNNCADNTLQVAEYNKHEIAIYNVTDDVITYYKSTGTNTWKQVTAAGADIT